VVGYFSGTVDWDGLPSTLPPPESTSSPLLPLPPSNRTPGVPRRIATQMPAILNLKFKVGSFFLITVCGYLTSLPPGQQIFCPVQQLERCGLFNQDLEGTQTPASDPRPSPPLTGDSALGLHQGRQLP